jgi:hypothetical protein
MLQFVGRQTGLASAEKLPDDNISVIAELLTAH